MAEPATCVTFIPGMCTYLAGGALLEISLPEGSIHEEPSGFKPYGSVRPAPVEGSIIETETSLQEPRVTRCATATAAPVIGFCGAVPIPSQPRLIEPSGARRVPF